MGKRSDFERRPRDAYATPYEAVVPLLPHLQPRTRFDEPCCGQGDLIRHLERHGHLCAGRGDIEPNPMGIQRDALIGNKCVGVCFITNPPWTRSVLHPLIVRLSDIAPTWLLFDADWLHTKQAVPFLPRLRRVVSVGRVKWIPDSKMTGKDNACWYHFDTLPSPTNVPFFYGRAA